MVLVGYWPLNEESGDTAYEHTGVGRSASVDSNVKQGENGILGGLAYDFDGSGYLTIPYYTALYPESITLSLWMNLETYDRVDGSMQRHVDGRTPGDWNDGYILESDDDADIRFNIPNIGNASFNGLSVNTWIHVAAIYNEFTGEIKLFLNGVLESVTSVSGSITDSGRKLRVSERSDISGEQTAGKLGKFRIYARALTPQEIQYLYQVGKRGRQVTSKKTS